MYFSLLTPVEGHERAAIHQRLAGPYADHQWLWRLFPAAPGTPRDFMFRRHDHDGVPRYYVVSHRAPTPIDDAWHLQCRDYAPNVEVGEQLQFELRVNPTVRHARDGKSKRHDVVIEAKKTLLRERGLQRWDDWQGDDKPALQELVHQACGAWLARRGEALGFELDADTVLVEAYEQHREKREGSLQFTSVDLRGRLTVTDPQAFNAALFNGIGHAKAFGCGLLLVRRIG
ncbi:MAG: type I-E CRISPR-associated protein Cas6/Cse3/CasE [Burkholderiales bacterium]